MVETEIWSILDDDDDDDDIMIMMMIKSLLKKLDSAGVSLQAKSNNRNNLISTT